MNHTQRIIIGGLRRFAERFSFAHEAELVDTSAENEKNAPMVSVSDLAVLDVRPGAQALKMDGDEQAWTQFYERFESQFRETGENIKSRLRSRYEELVKNWLKQNRSFSGTHTCGLGRQEFDEILKYLGFLSIVTLASKDHAAPKGPFGYLSDLSACSLSIVGSFHQVEYLSPPHILKLFKEVHRVLQPGGIFICETPSLYSLWSSQRQFYLDPIKERPVHPDFLKFLAEDTGFKDIQIKQFDQVDTPDRARLSAVPKDKRWKAELQKLEAWLYGGTDIALVAFK